MIPKRFGPFGPNMPYVPTPAPPIVPPRISDPPNMNTNQVAPGTNSPGQGSEAGGLFGLSNSTLLFIGIGLIAVIYFIKKK